MRRVDVLGIGLGLFVAGGLVYLALRGIGLDSQAAGIWSQVAFMAILIGWLLTYAFRAVTQQMTYNQQLKDYAQAVLQKRLEALTPEELAQLQVDLKQERTKVLDQP